MQKIGGQKIKDGVLLAPMAGVTDSAFRIICRELGFMGLMFTEMVSAKGLCYGDAKSYEIAAISDAERPIGIQLFGSEPDIVAGAVELLSENSADFIDINMGCPMPKITKNGEGSALMLDPVRAQAVVKAAVASAAIPVSVKIRKGWDDARVNAVEFAKRMESAGASMIAIHGRTREQMYGRQADWQIIADVKEAVGIPVVGNGDVLNAGDVVRMFRETGCDGVMLGRAVRGNPWFPKIAEDTARSAQEKTRSAESALGRQEDCSRSSEDTLRSSEDSALSAFYPMFEREAHYPSIAEKIIVMKRHLELATLKKGDKIGVLETRKHLAWYTKGMRGAAAIRDDINKLTDYREVLRFIDGLAEASLSNAL